MSENQEKRTDNRNSVTGLIGDFPFKKNSHHDEEESCAGHSQDPGKTMLTVTGNEGQGRGEEDDKADCDVNPG